MYCILMDISCEMGIGDVNTKRFFEFFCMALTSIYLDTKFTQEFVKVFKKLLS